MDDKERLNMKCPMCGKEFSISYGRYRRFNSDHIFMCTSCTNAEKSRLSKERYNNLSDEGKKKYVASLRNLTHEQRQKHREATSKGLIKFWAGKNYEDKQLASRKIRDGMAKRSEEEILRWKETLSKIRKKPWEGLTLEEKKERMTYLFAGSKRFQENLTDDQKAELSKKVSDGLKRWYHDASPEELQRRYDHMAEAARQRISNMSHDEVVTRMKKLWNHQVSYGPTEFAFKSDIEDYGFIEGLSFIQDYNTADIGYIDPQFWNIFPHINPITNAFNSPYHRWDFRVFSAVGPDILIDIDGSCHNPKYMNFRRSGNNFTERELIDYNDSKRPYQVPDGCIAVRIQCYNDELKSDSKVYSIKDVNGTDPIRYYDFIGFLLSIQLKPEEITINEPMTSTTIGQL